MNPYQVGEPILNPEAFYGRTDEINHIKTILQSNSVLIFGEQRIGKTSILRHIEQTINGNFIPCFIQLSGATPGTFWRLMGKGLDSCQKAGITTHDLHIPQDYDGLDLREDIKYIINCIQKVNSKGKLLLILDEIDVINNLPDYIQDTFRAIAQDFTPALKILAAGLNIKDTETATSAGYNFFHFVEIKPLTTQAARELIEKPVGKAYWYLAEAVDYILSQSLGRPYVIQLWCYYIIEKNKQRKQITLKDVKSVFEDVKNELNFNCRWLH